MCLAATSCASMAATSCVSNTNRGSCTFFPRTTIFVDRPLGLTIVNEEWHEATFNKKDDKFDDLPMPFTVESTSGDPIAYSLTVQDSQHACYESVGGIAVGEPISISVNLSIDGSSTSLGEPVEPDRASIFRKHQITMHFSNDHKATSTEKWCSGKVQIEAELAEL